MLYLILAPAFAGAPESGLKAVLDSHVADGKVNYAAVASAGALDDTVTALEVATEPSSRDARMAFWINAYNVLTIDLVADNWPLSSIRDLDEGKVWDTRRFTVAGKQVTLNDIEHKILRPMGDPRIHAAVNCAAIGCPPLHEEPFSASKLESQLDAASKRWIATNGIAIDQGTNKVRFNKIFDWYGEDFTTQTDIPGIDGKAERAAIFAAKYLDAEQAAWLKAGGYDTGWIDYDWGVNAK